MYYIFLIILTLSTMLIARIEHSSLFMVFSIFLIMIMTIYHIRVFLWSREKKKSLYAMPTIIALSKRDIAVINSIWPLLISMLVTLGLSIYQESVRMLDLTIMVICIYLFLYIVFSFMLYTPLKKDTPDKEMID